MKAVEYYGAKLSAEQSTSGQETRDVVMAPALRDSGNLQADLNALQEELASWDASAAAGETVTGYVWEGRQGVTSDPIEPGLTFRKLRVRLSLTQGDLRSAFLTGIRSILVGRVQAALASSDLAKAKTGSRKRSTSYSV